MSSKDRKDFDWLYDGDKRRQVYDKPTDTLDESDEPLPVGHWQVAKRHPLRKAAMITFGVAVLGVLGTYGYDHVLNDDSHISKPAPGPSLSPDASASPTHKASASPTSAECVAGLPLEFKLGQKIMISATAATLPQAERVAEKYDIGGIIMMDQASASAVRSLQAKQTVTMLVATDQEGGIVQRYKSEGLLPAAADVPNLNLDVLYKDISFDDRFLKSQGINMNLAPVVDVAPVDGQSVLGSRVFSSDPAVVSKDAAVYLRAGLNNGLLMTMKHFPGMGSASGNTDNEPATTPSFSQLKQRDLIPYENLAGTKAAVMVGNQTVPGLTDGLPASLSRAAITDELRDTLGYKYNVVITDSLTAKAITNLYSVSEAAVQSWEAGSDIALLVSSNPNQTLEPQVASIIQLGRQAVKNGQLPEKEVNASVGRLFALPQKQADACAVATKLQ